MLGERELAIISVAGEMVRQGGYNSFSFRNVAKVIGIKSSSIHYHFATKEDLGVAVAKTYREKFIDSLGNPKELLAQGKDPIENYVRIFHHAAKNGKGMCLFGVLGSESDVLPKRVLAETRRFFESNIDWLRGAYLSLGQRKNAHDKALQTLSMMEGAMITSHVMNDVEIFNSAVKLLSSYKA